MQQNVFYSVKLKANKKDLVVHKLTNNVAYKHIIHTKLIASAQILINPHL